MFEFTTGVIFLISSFYSSGHGTDMSNQIASSTASGEATTTEARTFTNTKQVENYVRKEYADTPILVEIARCESTFKQFGKNGGVIRGIVNSADIGVMQINERYHASRANKLGYDIYSTEGNVAFAKYLYDRYGSQPWSASSRCWSRNSNELAKI